MSHLLARIMLALLMLPLAAVVYGLTIVLLIEVVLGYQNDTLLFAISGLVTSLFIAAYWIALWRRTVRWTRTRIVYTGSAVLAAAVAGAAVGGLGSIADSDFGIFIGWTFANLAWLALTVFAWQETKTERAARIKTGTSRVVTCPRCGYNMTGLGQAACPECGASFTIDELIDSQPEQAATDFERSAG